MSPGIETVVFVIGILALLTLDRDRTARTSKALWIPVMWLLIIGSRGVSQWLGASPPVTPDQYLEGSPLDGAVFAVLIAAAFIVLAGRGRQVSTLLRGNGPILLFYLYCAASILWSDYPIVASKRWIKFLGDFMMVLIILTDTDPSTAVKRFFAWTGFLLVPLSVLLILYYPELGSYPPEHWRAYYAWIHELAWSGVTTNKNALGIICMIFGLASLWRFLQELRGEDGRHRVGPLIAHSTVLAMVLWLFAMANSVTPLVCFALAGGLMVIVTGPIPLARRRATVHILVATILFVSLFATFLNQGALLREVGRDATLNGRTELWNQLISMTANPLLGTGFESFWLGERLKTMWDIFGWHPNEAHNGYLEIYLNLGWIGIALLAVILVTGYQHVVGAFRRDPWTGSLKLAYFVAAVVFNLAEAGFRMTYPVWDIFLLAMVASKAPVGEGAKILHWEWGRPDPHDADLPAARRRVYGGGI